MALDIAVSRAVARSRLLERALHSVLPWFIDVGGVQVLAERIVHDHGVEFVACFARTPADAASAALYEGDEMVSSRPFDDSEPGEFCLVWNLALEETVAA